MNDIILAVALDCAVPLWIDELKRSHFSFEEIQRRAHLCADVVAHQGDVIQFRSKKAGGTAVAFNRLAEGLACLAFAPGGVNFLGRHWEVKREE